MSRPRTTTVYYTTEDDDRYRGNYGVDNSHPACDVPGCGVQDRRVCNIPGCRYKGSLTPSRAPSGQRSRRPRDYESEQRRYARDTEPLSKFSGRPLSELYAKKDRYYQDPEESHLEETQRARKTSQRSADPSYRSERPERPIRPPPPLRSTPSRRERWSQVDDTKCGTCGSTNIDLMGNEDGGVFECHGCSGQFTLMAKPETKEPSRLLEWIYGVRSE